MAGAVYVMAGNLTKNASGVEIMLEVLQFIFSSFWIWLGTLILVVVITEGIGGMGRKIVNNISHKATQAEMEVTSDQKMP